MHWFCKFIEVGDDGSLGDEGNDFLVVASLTFNQPGNGSPC